MGNHQTVVGIALRWLIVHLKNVPLIKLIGYVNESCGSDNRSLGIFECRRDIIDYHENCISVLNYCF